MSTLLKGLKAGKEKICVVGLEYVSKSTFQLHDSINDNEEGELSINGLILSIFRKPLANH
ncbi:MAG: hypothetical protein ACO2OY_02920 [Thermodesulfobacteriaceae bacterium]|jgi:hypothetical protein